MRNGDWMQTYSGRQFWPLDPRADEVAIDDIAHSLAHLCRYGGHCLRFYSVAEHSVHIARAASPQNRRPALLHDAAEAYIADVIRPVKHSLHDYLEIEGRVHRAITERFGIAATIPAEVNDLDNRILGDEQRQVMSRPPVPWYYFGEPLGITLECWSPDQAKTEFLTMFDDLWSDGRAA